MKFYRGILSEGEHTVRVTAEGGDVDLDPRWDLRNHSPTGFAWGYSGSGPSQLALAILADCLKSDDRALKLYQAFKQEKIATLPIDKDWTMTEYEVIDWVNTIERAL